MIRVIIAHETFLKLQPLQSKDLPEQKKFRVGQFKEFDLEGYSLEGSHYKVILQEPIKGHTTWYVFKDHCYIQDTRQTNPNPGGGSSSPGSDPTKGNS